MHKIRLTTRTNPILYSTRPNPFSLPFRSHKENLKSIFLFPVVANRAQNNTHPLCRGRGGAASWFWSGCIHMFLEPSRTLQLLRRLRAFWSLGMSVTPRLKPEVASSFNGKLNLLVNDVETNIRNPTAECTLMNILHSWLLT
ncbi:unnamed protein product [Prunus armeniaca]